VQGWRLLVRKAQLHTVGGLRSRTVCHLGDDLIGRDWQNASPDQGGNLDDIYTS
jgi:hypothetical protein